MSKITTEITNEHLLARIIALEGALAYTAAACTSQDPQVKDLIVNALARDAPNQPNPAFSEAILRIAQIINSFKA